MGTNIVLVNRTETEQLGKCLQLIDMRTDDYNISSEAKTGTGDEYLEKNSYQSIKTSNNSKIKTTGCW